MKQVLIAAVAEKHEFFRNSILAGPDIHTVFHDDYELAKQTYFLTQPNLFVFWDPEGLLIGPFMAELNSQGDNASPVVLVTDKALGTPMLDVIKRVLPTKVEEAAFNEATATILGLPIRRSIRIPIRIGVTLSDVGSTLIASTVTLSKHGMLVESSEPLVPGQTYQFRFMGFKDAMDDAPLWARVLRQEGWAEKEGGSMLYAMEFPKPTVERMDGILVSLTSA